VLTDLTIREFLERVASGEPIPGGGSVAALAAGLSAALSGMVARLTIGKKGDPILDQKMAGVADRAVQLQKKLVRDVDNDSEAYAAVMKSYRMAKGTEDERSARSAAIEDALKEAARVPLSVAEAGKTLLDLAGTVVTEGSSSAMTDGLVAALMARSAVIGALYNVRVNLLSIKDPAFGDEMVRRVGALEEEVIDKENEILAFVGSAIRKEV
jgi:methenyltetrahydrofolate cyclohydrolase